MRATANGRVALVTGSSRGLGSEIARRLAADGHAVAVNDSKGGRDAESVAARLRDRGEIAEAFGADVTDEIDLADLVEAISGRLGPVEVLVVNATGAQPEAPLVDVRWEDHLEQLDFFVKSPVLLGRAVVPAMRGVRAGARIGTRRGHRVRRQLPRRPGDDGGRNGRRLRPTEWS